MEKPQPELSGLLVAVVLILLHKSPLGPLNHVGCCSAPVTCQHAPSQRKWRLYSRARLVFLCRSSRHQRLPWVHSLELPAPCAAAHHPRACLICPLPSCRSLHTVKMSPSHRTSVFDELLSPPLHSAPESSELDVSCPEALLTFRGPLCHVFLSPLGHSVPIPGH